MTIDCNKLKKWPFTDVVQTYTDTETIMYALSMGLGSDPTDENQLKFVYEKNLQALPMMANVLGYPGLWIRDPDSGVEWQKVLHGEQSMRIHKPLPVAGTISARTRVAAVIDKGPGKGALLVQERKIHDKATGDLLATLEGVSFCRGDGGFSTNGGADGKQVSDAPPSDARGPGHRQGRRIPRPDPARTGHLRDRGSGRAQDLLRLRSGETALPAHALYRAGVSGRNDPHGDVERGRHRVFPRQIRRARPHRAQ